MLDWRGVRNLSVAALFVAGTGLPQALFPELQAHLKAANADIDSEKYAEAADELRAAIAIRPALRGAYYQLGFALFHLNRFAEAEKAFTKELDFQPPDAYSLYYLGRISADRGQREQSISFYEKSAAAG